MSSPLSHTPLAAMNMATPRRQVPERNIMDDISDANTSQGPSSSPFNSNPDTENLPPEGDHDDTFCSAFSAIPTPKGNSNTSSNANDTTNLILDFTEQFNSLSTNYYRASPSKRERGLSPSKTASDLASYTNSQRTPSPKKAARMSNLLDFDIPPAPTPRSMPSITPRELETLRSGFLCEISNLKAELSGKEAETSALKKAVADAEKRTGENMEKLREEQQMKDQLMVEKELLEKRSHEMEQVLRNVKEEIVLGERERDELEGRLDECEKRREAAEMMHQEAESRIAAMRSGSKPVEPLSSADEKKAQPDPEAINKEVELAVEKVARELHTLYKGKHETKVAALKKSYEARWQRKVKDLEDKLEQLSKDYEDLKTGRDATMSGVVPTVPANNDMTEFQAELKAQAAKDAATAKELEAKLLGLTEEVKCINRENASLRKELDNERVEKGELVAAVEEMFALQLQNQEQQLQAQSNHSSRHTSRIDTSSRDSEFSSNSTPASPASASTASPATKTKVAVENLRGSVSRASGLRMPSAGSGATSAVNGESRIGKFGGGYGLAGHDRNKHGGSGVSASGPGPGSAIRPRSGIMSSIEKMGKGGSGSH